MTTALFEQSETADTTDDTKPSALHGIQRQLLQHTISENSKRALLDSLTLAVVEQVQPLAVVYFERNEQGQLANPIQLHPIDDHDLSERLDAPIVVCLPKRLPSRRGRAVATSCSGPRDHRRADSAAGLRSRGDRVHLSRQRCARSADHAGTNDRQLFGALACSRRRTATAKGTPVIQRPLSNC